MDPYKIIKHPLSTEKSIRLMESQNKLIFVVDIDADKKMIKNAIEEMFKLAISLGGTITGEHGIGKIKSRFLSLEFKEEEIKLMKQIKDTLDPNKILNPGKIF